MNRSPSCLTIRYLTLSLIAVLGVLAGPPCRAQFGTDDLFSMINTSSDSTGGQRVVAFTANAPIRYKLRVGDVILQSVVKGKSQPVSTRDHDGLAIIAAAMRDGQEVELTVLRPRDTNDPPQSYDQLKILISSVDFQSAWSVGSSTNHGAAVRGGTYSFNANPGYYHSDSNSYSAHASVDRDIAYSVGDALPEPPVERGVPQFPWPPPLASATHVVPRKLLEQPYGKATLLRDVDERLTTALSKNGYSDKGYFAVPQGFALVTRIEHINDDGVSIQGAARWSLNQLPLQTFSLTSYLKALFNADPGKYRVIVFVLTQDPFQQSKKTVTAEEAQVWLSEGLNVLPKRLGDLPFTTDYECTALIYEFQRASKVSDPKQIAPGLPGLTHLQKAGLWGVLSP